jgi:dethiobiotin synthetase
VKAFVTATGTNIGKTYVTCGLLRHMRREAQATLALKPVASGFDPASAADSDSARLLEAQNCPVTLPAIAAISPWRFAAPLSPDWAAALEQRSIDYAALLAFCRHTLQTPASVLIEGIGGVMVPLDATHTVLDLMADLALPVILVAGSYLGTLSHTLTALAVLRARNLPAVVVVSDSPGVTPDPDRTAATIARHAQVATIRLRRTRPPDQDAAFADIVRVIGELVPRSAEPLHRRGREGQ